LNTCLYTNYLSQFSFLLLLCLFLPLKAQNTAAAQVNITLAPILSLEISQATVNIDMSLPSQFTQGSSSSLQTDHIKVSTTSAYTISVNTSTANFELTGSSTTLAVNTVQLEVSPNVPSNVITYTPIYLSPTSEVIIDSNAETVTQTFNAQYSIPNAKTHQYLNRASGNYKTMVVYTIAPK